MYRSAKIYFDGSHFIVIPGEHFPARKRCGKSVATKTIAERLTKKDLFEKLYDELKDLLRKEKWDKITERILTIEIFLFPHSTLVI